MTKEAKRLSRVFHWSMASGTRCLGMYRVWLQPLPIDFDPEAHQYFGSRRAR